MSGTSHQLFLTPPSAEWLLAGALFGALVVFIALAEYARFLLKWSPEVTRKLVHVSVGVLISFAPDLFVSGIPPLALATVFILINFAAIGLGLLKGMHGAQRASYGTVYYPLAFLLLVLLLWEYEPAIISLSMLVLAFADAAAAIVGETHPAPRTYVLSTDKKSLEGSVTMFSVSAITLFVGLTQFGEAAGMTVLGAFTAAVVSAAIATAWEGISSRGFDNLTIPLSVAFVLWVFLRGSSALISQFTVGTSLALLVAFVSYYARFLTASGSVATFLLAGIVFGLGGWKWTVPILAFFVLSSILSQVGKSRKSDVVGLFEKSGPRDYGQVAANGGLAGILVLLKYFFPEFDFYPLYLGALSAVTADTWGTEIGLLSSAPPVLVTTWKRVAKGTSGAVTLAGLGGTLAGSALIALTGWMWMKDWPLLVLVVVAGVIASLADSVAGATLQARYRCVVCGKETERSLHCNSPAELVAGKVWIRNDTVNGFCSSAGAILVWTFMAVGSH